MTAIVKTQSDGDQPPQLLPVALPSHALAWQGLWERVRAHMQARQAHPARTVVLLPFFQLQAVARATSRAHWPSGFTPRLETTKSWSQRISHFVPGELDISFDAGLDSLRASAWLQRAGLASRQGMLGAALVQTAQQLGSLVAAVPPAQRPAWAEQARAQALQSVEKLGSNPLMYEAAVARIALEWAVASRYASDVLFDEAQRASLDALIVVPGLQANPLALALAAHWSDISQTMALSPAQASPHIALHEALNGHDEAERAAACVLQHIGQGHVPVALAAVDRVSTRRISATLQLHGVQAVDETGWKLSTTRAAASVMALLRAARLAPRGAQAQAGADDALLDWLKHTSVPMAQLNQLESTLRKPNSTPAQSNAARAAIQFIANEMPDAELSAPPSAPQSPTRAETSAEALLASLRRSRPIAQWLAALEQALRSSGQWARLMADSAGRDCVQALHLLQAQALAGFAQPMDLTDFNAWASGCLENASFKPSADAQEQAQVVVLPLAQVLARPFAAIVIAGADEQRLSAAPEPVGAWTAQQRQALGLPSREALAAEQAAVWAAAMQVPQGDVLWRRAEGEQALQPSALVQRWQLQHAGHLPPGADPRPSVAQQARPTLAPQPTAGALRVAQLSASSYGDLRTCPYRFFALRLLGLQDMDELDTEVDKRDFGSWLHSVLSEFHTRRRAAPDAVDDPSLLDACAAEQRIADSGFIPFAAAWPQVRESYLLWLTQHEAEGWQFDQAELSRKLMHGEIELLGRLDRIDRLGRGPLAGTAYVLDYKTESVQTSKERVKNPLEDTQLAFYAALLGEDDIHAAYVNVAERDCKVTPQPDIMAARDALLDGISTDVQRIHAGHSLPALGEGKACDFCSARGLCRKDMWFDQNAN